MVQLLAELSALRTEASCTQLVAFINRWWLCYQCFL